MKINFEDEVQALLLLSSMPDSWNTLVVSVSNSAPDGKLTLDMVKNSMLNEEVILANRDPLGTPRGRYDEHSSKFSLSKKPRFNRTSRRRESLLKVLLVDL